MASIMDHSTIPYAAILGLFTFVYFVVYPVVEYFRDPKQLRRYPALSPLAGVSNVPFAILAHSGARSTKLVELHKKHPIIRTGPNTLSFGDARSIKDIYGHNSKCTKDDLYMVTAGSHFHLADVLDKADHSRKRKVLSSAYALKNLEQWEYKVADKTVRLINHLDKCCTAPLPAHVKTPLREDLTVDYREWTNYFTLDAIADIGLSEPLGMLDRGNDVTTVRRPDGTTYDCEFRQAMYQNARKQSLLVWSYEWYKVINRLADAIPFYGRMGKLAKEWDGIPVELAQRRLTRYEAGEKLDDFFQALMEDKSGRAHELEWGEIVAEVSIMMNAGSATTAIAMANVLLQLLKNPRCMQELRAELDSALGDEDEQDGVAIAHDRVKHLPYLRACLDESLRLFPPTPQNLGRKTPAGGCYVLDQHIPAGVSVGISALVAHRDEKVFPQSDKFIPERWLGEEGKSLQPYFLAFSAGARGCIGRNISYLEQTVLLASVLQRYEFALPSPTWDIERLETMNWILGKMPLKVWRRNQGTKAE